MHVDVSQILSQEEGARVDYQIDGEEPDVDVKLTQPLTGRISLLRTDDGLVATGDLQTSVELECHRCLRTFDHTLKFPFQAVYRLHPTEDEFPISSRGIINLDEPVRQEIIIHLPQQQLCAADCAGLKLAKETHGRT